VYFVHIYYHLSHLTSPDLTPNHTKNIDHNQIWTQLPRMDFPEHTLWHTQPALLPQTSPSGLIRSFSKDTRTTGEYELKIRSKEKNLRKNPSVQTLADLIQKKQEILAKEVRWLQDKAWKARRRAGGEWKTETKTKTTSDNGSSSCRQP